VEAVAFSSSLGACSSFCRAGREGDGCRHGDAVQPASGAQGRLPRGRARFGSLAQIRRRFRSRSRRPEAKMRTRLAGTSRAGTPETGIRPAESARAVAGPPRERPSGQQKPVFNPLATAARARVGDGRSAACDGECPYRKLFARPRQWRVSRNGIAPRLGRGYQRSDRALLEALRRS
jgi:hypothetical protein